MPGIRLLVLGCVRYFQPAHGYEIRRALQSWDVESWSNINAGSVYHALNQLTRDGFLEVSGTEQDEGRPARTLYHLTEYGESEFFRLLRQIGATSAVAVDEFGTALSFLWALSGEEAQRILIELARRSEQSAARLRAAADDFDKAGDGGTRYRWVVAEEWRLSAELLDARARWASRLLDRYSRGELAFDRRPGEGDDSP